MYFWRYIGYLRKWNRNSDFSFKLELKLKVEGEIHIVIGQQW